MPRIIVHCVELLLGILCLPSSSMVSVAGRVNGLEQVTLLDTIKIAQEDGSSNPGQTSNLVFCIFFYV